MRVHVDGKESSAYDELHRHQTFDETDAAIRPTKKKSGVVCTQSKALIAWDKFNVRSTRGAIAALYI